MRPTRRGWTVLVVVLVAFGSAVTFGPRGLNAIVAPGVVVLGAAVWQLQRFEPPVLSRNHPRRGAQGGTVRVRLVTETETPRSARVVERAGESIALDRTLTLGRTALSYDIDLGERGELTVGPTTVTARDVLGLLQRTIDYPKTDSILVHPPVQQLPGPIRTALAEVYGGVGEERQAVEGIRHYRRGDPLRDVHWRKSATQADGELVVKRFSTEGSSRTVAIAAESDSGAADGMARVAASVGVALLEAGVSITLETPSGRVDRDAADRRGVLDHLARAGPGRVGDGIRREADILIRSSAAGVTVSVGTLTLEVGNSPRPRRIDRPEEEASA